MDKKCERFFIDENGYLLLVKILFYFLKVGDIVYKRGVSIGFIIGIVKGVSI